ncbi:GntR family transcriptional regulator [Aureimonas phyllosphaerae]|uniref:DNA-binding GntR family transcriptional regulator n=1 Tax=Aureimonas phyllosphaerae TaxID=1166078 RepID=A0A7W6FWG5_9HYPH|nr:GntR family transcriptional regulator [Aureimonas phyllosphaerae]MBB3937007.1 DNA-binding GntR family transcriptional regulator [Aureimonas phyllosphaerae]MBB3960878.1 DNA-binding GntR family transcriptional regulator [Aureimonas phyllosphaerae]SFF51639.1 transcriptional regulator, GntR family [Aureimonas phyllosphaerae]
MSSNEGAAPTAAADRSPNLANLAYRSVADMIRSRRLRGGDVIVEAKLAATLGVSRTPMREALQRLEGEGLVHKGEGRNYVVRRVDLGEYLQSLRLRLLIEPEAAVLALDNIPRRTLLAVRLEILELLDAKTYHTDQHWFSDDHLHGMIIDHCGNAVMARVLRDLRAATRLFEIDQLKERLIPDSSEHLQIIEAIQASDAEATRESVAQHIRSLIGFAMTAFQLK